MLGITARSPLFLTVAAITFFSGPPLVQQCGTENLTRTNAQFQNLVEVVQVPIDLLQGDQSQGGDPSLVFNLVDCLSGNEQPNITDTTEGVSVYAGDMGCRIELQSVMFDGVSYHPITPFTDFETGDQAVYQNPDDPLQLAAFEVMEQLTDPITSDSKVAYYYTFSGHQEADAIADSADQDIIPPLPQDHPEPVVEEEEDSYLEVEKAMVLKRHRSVLKPYNFFDYGKVWMVDTNEDGQVDTCQTIANGLAIYNDDLPVSTNNGFSVASCLALNEPVEVDQSPHNPVGSQQIARDLQQAAIAGIELGLLLQEQPNVYLKLMRSSERLYRKVSRILRKQAMIEELATQLVTDYSYDELKVMTSKQRRDAGLQGDFKILTKSLKLARRIHRISENLDRNIEKVNHLRAKADMTDHISFDLSHDLQLHILNFTASL